MTIAHLTMKVRQIAINFFSERERQMTRDYLAMLVMFAHLAIKEGQIASNFFLQKRTPSDYRNLLCMSYQTNYSKREYFVYVLSYTWDIKIYGIFCLCFITYMWHLNLNSPEGVRAYLWILSKYLSVRPSVHPSVHPFVCLFVCLSPWDHFGSINY